MTLLARDCPRTFTLRGITGHGKNRIREHGSVWVEQPTDMSWDNGILVTSVKTLDSRWIKEVDDPNFEIVSVGPHVGHWPSFFVNVP